ncbi:MAG: hypothetical protein Q9181_000926 [Wetmoreana brouardii]
MNSMFSSLERLNIKYTVFERENYINERRRDWNFGIYHAQAPLEECLPKSIFERLMTAIVDPNRGLSEHDYLPSLNAQTGERLMAFPSPNVLRFSRSKFRALIAEGIDIQYGKRLSSILCPDNNSPVTAQFEDGTAVTGSIVIGAEGANSKVREYLLGPEQAALQELPILGIGAVESPPADISRKIREINDLYFVSYHPEGVCAFMALHDVPDSNRPETWKWMYSLTWNDKTAKREQPVGPEAIKQEWTFWAEKLAEPFRSAYLTVLPDATLWCDRLAQWPTIPWDMCNGRVTLAGDAAHPMTYHRGQGLNNAIHDAAHLCNALNEHHAKGVPMSEALAVYEKEMQERGRAAVISSGENSLMVHDWEQLRKSPVFTMGLRPLEKKG